MKEQRNCQLTLTGRTVAWAAMALLLAGCATTPAANDPEPTAERLAAAEQAVRAGDEAARRGELEEALTGYLSAVNTKETPERWFRIAAVCVRLGKTERAIQSYLRVLHLDPVHAGAEEGLGLEYLALNNMGAAAHHLVNAISVDPARWRAHNALGVLADQAQDHQAAIEHYEAALSAHADSPMLLNNLGYSRYLAGDLDQAARDLYRATQLDSEYLPAWKNLGLVYARRGWYEDALGVLTRVMELPTAFNDVGYLALLNGDYPEAEALLLEAVRLSPSYYATAYRNLELARSNARMQANGIEISRGRVRLRDDASSEGVVGGLRKVESSGLKVRQTGALNAPVVGYLKSGDTVEVLKDDAGWSQVTYADQASGGQASGWVRSSYLSASAQTDES